MQYNPNNIFAKILRNEMSAVKIYENSTNLVIMDAMPQSDGHLLVLPKSPARNILDIEPSALASTILLVQQLAIASKAALNADGVSIMQFNEEAGGQSVYHLHFHVIPRWNGVKLRPHSGEFADTEVLKSFANKISAELQALLENQ